MAGLGATSRMGSRSRHRSRVDPWLKLFTAGYVLVGIGILVEIARRLGMGFIIARAELEEEKSAAKQAART